MRIKSEKDLLDIEVRKQIIEEIESRENITRKNNSYKRYQCYKDKTNHYVVEHLLQQFDIETVSEMTYALSNVSIAKKVIDKLARVYNNGVERAISGSEEGTKKIKELEKKLDINTAMKKTNRLLKLEKNVDLFVKPYPVYELNKPVKWAVGLDVLAPHLYDVVEDYYNRTKAMCVILSDYTPPTTALSTMEGKRAPVPASAQPMQANDGVDQMIADNPQDQKNHVSTLNKKMYVFWSKNLHFTCNCEGEIVADETNPNNVNPMGVFNHINFALDQDGAFWAEGGDDLIDGAVLVNALITHTNHMGTLQGYGQFYMTGENLPRSLKVGPTNAIIAEYKLNEQAKPEMGFLNANPQLDSMRSLVEMYIALYLTTNNLSTSGVSTQLSGAALASGIAIIIDKAESLEDVQDQRQVFADKEPDVFEAIDAVLKTFKDGNLIEELKGLQLPEGFKKDFNIKFFDPTPIMTEKEKLENMKLRQELGVDSLISMLMKDDPSLDEKQAEEKLKKVIEQRIKEKMLEAERMKAMGIEIEDSPDDENAQGDNTEDAKDQQDLKETGANNESSQDNN